MSGHTYVMVEGSVRLIFRLLALDFTMSLACSNSSKIVEVKASLSQELFEKYGVLVPPKGMKMVLAGEELLDETTVGAAQLNDQVCVAFTTEARNAMQKLRWTVIRVRAGEALTAGEGLRVDSIGVADNLSQAVKAYHVLRERIEVRGSETVYIAPARLPANFEDDEVCQKIQDPRTFGGLPQYWWREGTFPQTVLGLYRFSEKDGFIPAEGFEPPYEAWNYPHRKELQSHVQAQAEQARRAAMAAVMAPTMGVGGGGSGSGAARPESPPARGPVKDDTTPAP